jgi:Family of unknown function (DUF6104)
MAATRSSELEGVSTLREARGSEQVRFEEIADHLNDFAAITPESRGTIDGLARFLARVEDEPHEHDDRDHTEISD